MEIRVINHGKRWIIVKNPTTIDIRKSRRGRPRIPDRDINSFDSCWTGSHWALEAHFAQAFDSSDDAELEVMLKRRTMELIP